MKIRYYEHQDLKEMILLFHNTVIKINSKDYNESQIKVWAKTLDTIDMCAWHQQFENSKTIVAVKDQLIVGFINIYDNGYLDKLYVHHNYQGQGIATMLCDVAEGSVSNPISVDSSITAYEFFINRGYKLQTVEYKIIHDVKLKRFKLLKG